MPARKRKLIPPDPITGRIPKPPRKAKPPRPEPKKPKRPPIPSTVDEIKAEAIKLLTGRITSSLTAPDDPTQPSQPLTGSDLVGAIQDLETLHQRTSTPYKPKMPSKEEVHRSVGRPPKYHPSMCQTIVDDAAEGHSLTATCHLLLVSRQTLNLWIDATEPNGEPSYPELIEAVSRAKIVRQRYWESHAVDMSRNGGDSGRFQAVKMGLLSMGREDWRDKVDDGAKLEVTFSFSDLIKKSMKIAGEPKVIEGEAVRLPVQSEKRE